MMPRRLLSFLDIRKPRRAELVEYGHSWRLSEEAIAAFGDRIYECESSHAFIEGRFATKARVFHVRNGCEVGGIIGIEHLLAMET